MATDQMLILAQGFVYVLGQAALYKRWTLVVCPNAPMRTLCQKVAAGVYPPGATCSGRTTMLPDGVRVTVLKANDESPVPADEPFDVAFLGWFPSEAIVGPQGPWRKNARSEFFQKSA